VQFVWKIEALLLGGDRDEGTNRSCGDGSRAGRISAAGKGKGRSSSFNTRHACRPALTLETNRLFINASREHVAACRGFNRLSARGAAMDAVSRLARKWHIQPADIASSQHRQRAPPSPQPSLLQWNAHPVRQFTCTR
jgi:hypothetical protein